MELVRSALLVAAVTFFPVSANALVIDVTGTSGSGVTTWTFSGSSVVTSGNAGFCGTNCAGSFGLQLFDDTGWENVGNYVSNVFNFQTVIATSSTAGVSVNGGTAQTIDRLYLDDDPGGAIDDFGIGVIGADLLFSTGDTVSWSGALQMAVDLSALAPDGLPASFTTSNFWNSLLGGRAGLGMTLNISSGVPEPAVLALMSLGLAFMGFKQHRNKQVA